ncbi:uncharacterized protein EDB91DRAFT_1251664 [Suillus paluster]|uniref:uncharacterized protein n=1 Tax=Suillus paluster TaxID=48578 RepID=UPI001B8777BE|nr:uncharacterized protein EDB91DRAFT_1251664 [Suillus paluster]KAG1732615.1 hypothetical protein EDB91DRAFT_1251664 [Suillus paluster]
MPHAYIQPQSVDYGMKLSSLMSAPKINDVPTMDVLTERELNGLILQEPDDGHLSHVLSLIFKTFGTTIPLANSLTVSLNTKTPLYLRNFRINQNSTNKGETESVSLYNNVNHCWNWVFPTHEWHASKLPDKSGQDLREDDEEDEEQDSEEEDQGNDGKDVAVDVDDSLADLGKHLPDVGTAPAGPMPPSTNDETNFAGFFNTVAVALTAANDKLTKFNPSGVIWTWSGANSTRPVKDEEIKCKPDLALLDDMEARWDTIKAVCKLTSQKYVDHSSTCAKTEGIPSFKAPALETLHSVCNGYRDLRVHLYDHSGGIVTPCINMDRDLDRFLHTFSCIVFGGLECIGYDPTISIFTKTLQPCQLQQSSTFTLPTTAGATDNATKYAHRQQNESAPVILESVPMEGTDDPISESEGPEPSRILKTLSQKNSSSLKTFLLHEGLPMPLPADPLLAPLPELIGKI